MFPEFEQLLQEILDAEQLKCLKVKMENMTTEKKVDFLKEYFIFNIPTEKKNNILFLLGCSTMGEYFVYKFNYFVQKKRKKLFIVIFIHDD